MYFIIKTVRSTKDDYLKEDNHIVSTVLSFRVADAMPEDVGQGYVRIDNAEMDKLEVIMGDIVEIQGRKTTVAKVVPCFANFKNQNIVQMESIIRENAGVGIDERVTLKKAVRQAAQTVILSPLDVTIDFSDAQDIKHLERVLNGLPVFTGDRVKVSLAGARSQYFTVIGTAPQDRYSSMRQQNLKLLNQMHQKTGAIELPMRM